MEALHQICTTPNEKSILQIDNALVRWLISVNIACGSSHFCSGWLISALLCTSWCSNGSRRIKISVNPCWRRLTYFLKFQFEASTCFKRKNGESTALSFEISPTSFEINSTQDMFGILSRCCQSQQVVCCRGGHGFGAKNGGDLCAEVGGRGVRSCLGEVKGYNCIPKGDVCTLMEHQ